MERLKFNIFYYFHLTLDYLFQFVGDVAPNWLKCIYYLSSDNEVGTYFPPISLIHIWYLFCYVIYQKKGVLLIWIFLFIYFIL